MERDLFEWCGWDLLGDTLLQFYGCTLKKPIGAFKVGTLIPLIVVDFENGVLQVLSKEKELLSEYRIKIVLDTQLVNLDGAKKLAQDKEIGDLRNQIDQLQAKLRDIFANGYNPLTGPGDGMEESY